MVGSAEDSPFLTPNELTIYYSGITATNDLGILRATRSSRTEPFGAGKQLMPVTVTGANTLEQGPVVAPNESALFFTKLQNGLTQGYDVWVAKGFGDGGFETPKEVAWNINDAGGDVPHSFVANELWFRRETNAFRILVNAADFQASNASQPIPVPEIEPTFGFVLSANGLDIYFTRDVDGDHRIFHARRSAFNTSFQNPTEVASVNELGADTRTGWVSGDGCRLYFHSTRPGRGALHLYMAERPN